MTNSGKIFLAVAAVSVVSVMATLNLIHKDGKKTSENSPNVAVSPDAVGEPTSSGGVSQQAGTKTGPTTQPSAGDSAVDASVKPDVYRSTRKEGADKPVVGGNSATETNQVGLASQVATSQRSSTTADIAPSQEASATSAANLASSASAQSPVGINDKVQTVQSTSAPVNAPGNVKPRPYFPGIEQTEGRVMVRDFTHRAGQNEDLVTVRLTVTDGGDEVSGRVWVVGEYVQRGTTGVMFMPSHPELQLSPDGKPQNPNVGLTFQMRSNTEKKFTLRRPGFEGEELIAIRVGVVDRKTSQLHLARMLVKQSASRTKLHRAKVELP